jgi:hypothetical protein
VWQPCVYQFDKTNIPALGVTSLSAGQETGHIPLKLDHDASFVLLGAKVVNAGANVLLFDPFTNQLMDDYVNPLEFASGVQPVTILEGPGIEVPAGSVFMVRFQGQ